MEKSLEGLEGFTELDIKKLQNIAIEVDNILREEINKSGLLSSSAEARVYNLKTVGVQGDQRTYKYPAEITLEDPRHADGSPYSEDEFYNFLEKLGTRIPDEVRDVNRVVYVTETRDDRSDLLHKYF